LASRRNFPSKGTGREISSLHAELETAFQIIFSANYRDLKLPMPEPGTFKNPKLALTNLIVETF